MDVARCSGKKAGLLSSIRSCGPWRIPPAGDEGTNIPDSARWFTATLQLLQTILLEQQPSVQGRAAACRRSRGCSTLGAADGRPVVEATMGSLVVVVVGPRAGGPGPMEVNRATEGGCPGSLAFGDPGDREPQPDHFQISAVPVESPPTRKRFTERMRREILRTTAIFPTAAPPPAAA
jgi:hypothetical protein